MNKYTTLYFSELSKVADFGDGLGSAISNYRPFDPSSALYSGAPALGGLGAAAGLIKGLATNPGFDETGQRKSRINAALKDALIGGGLGAGAALALPSLGQIGMDIGGQLRSSDISAGTPGGGLGETLMKPFRHLDNAISTSVGKQFLPNVTLSDLARKVTGQEGYGTVSGPSGILVA